MEILILVEGNKIEMVSCGLLAFHSCVKKALGEECYR